MAKGNFLYAISCLRMLETKRLDISELILHIEFHLSSPFLNPVKIRVILSPTLCSNELVEIYPSFFNSWQNTNLNPFMSEYVPLYMDFNVLSMTINS